MLRHRHPFVSAFGPVPVLGHGLVLGILFRRLLIGRFGTVFMRGLSLRCMVVLRFGGMLCFGSMLMFWHRSVFRHVPMFVLWLCRAVSRRFDTMFVRIRFIA